MYIYSFPNDEDESITLSTRSLTSEDTACIYSNEFDCIYYYDKNVYILISE